MVAHTQPVEKGVQDLQLVEGVREGRHLVQHERVDEDVADRAAQDVEADHGVEHREAQRQPVPCVGRGALLDRPEQGRASRTARPPRRR